ncbi:MAG: hypothetical protein ABFD79_06240 [Phycisphaerales bacterium]
MNKAPNSFFDDFLNAGNSNCGEPYQPKPPAENKGAPSADDFYSELNKEIESIGGISLEFGNHEIKKIDANNHTIHVKVNRSHILGDGLLVSGVKPTDKLPGIAGVCIFCKQESADMYQKGLIDLQEAERRSLFSTLSGSQCQGCLRRDVCVRHCCPVDVEGEILNLCPLCVKAIEDNKLISMAKNVLFALFQEEEIKKPKQLPPGTQENNNENL